MDEQTAQEETEDKLKQCLDNLMDKRWVCLGKPEMGSEYAAPETQTQYQGDLWLRVTFLLWHCSV